jgi:hypothetical protein
MEPALKKNKTKRRMKQAKDSKKIERTEWCGPGLCISIGFTPKPEKIEKKNPTR